MKQLLLIVNPAAGKKKAEKHIAEITDIFKNAGYAINVHITSCSGDAENAVKSYGANTDAIVCCGGDGTLNETVAGVIGLELDIPIGYIPAGSTNDFARTLSISSDLLRAAEQIVSGTAAKYDVGKFGTRYFTYVASFGAFTSTSYSTSQKMKNRFGHAAYIMKGFPELFKPKREHVKITLDDEEFESDYLFGAICNSTSIGGFVKLEESAVDMSDGKFEVLLIKSPKNIFGFIKCIIDVRRKKFDKEKVIFRSAKKIKVSGNPRMAWSLDGEKCDGNEEIIVENLNKKITIIH